MLSKNKTLEKIKENEKKRLVFPMTEDIIFKSVIQDENLKDYVAFLIQSINKRKIKPENIVFINTKEVKTNAKDKLNIHDILIKITKT